MSRKFRRTKEDFVCRNCGVEIRGTGYTNHCPKCLWSLHVDENPGDRQALCKGLMEPSGVDMKDGQYVIIHRCLVCGAKKRNKMSPQDNFEAILEILKKAK